MTLRKRILAIDPGSCPGHEDQTGNMTPVLQSLAPGEDIGVVTDCDAGMNTGCQTSLEGQRGTGGIIAFASDGPSISAC